MTATMVRSAYPPAVEALIPRAIELTTSLGGELPSLNRLKRELHIGPDKAKLVLIELAALAERDGQVSDAAPEPVREAEPERPHEPLRPVIFVEDEMQKFVAGGPQILPDYFPPGYLTDDPAPAAAPVDAIEAPPVITDSAAATDFAVAAQLDVADARPESPPLVVSADAPARAPRRPVAWPVLLLALPAFVAIWSGWVSLGELAGFGLVHPLPGIADALTINTAITLPIGVETYAAYALWVWLSGRAPQVARRFAKWSAIGSLLCGALGQITYHLMAAAGVTSAPWLITAAVACLPVAVLGMGAALAHLLHAQEA